ncbi:hypothetical protein GJAV_G00056840 [Gymnothorax javanicus]|nr:hypothetical protein GJAV_G00056840 [Gymnothorax javanicus]
MHWEKMPPPEQPSPRPYQGVRVKDPVKELLRRKRRARFINSKSPPPTASAKVVVPNTVLSSHPQVGPSDFFEMAGSVSEVPAVENGTFCTGWIAQATPAPLQSVTHWPCPDPLTLDPSSSAHTMDMYVQPMCPSYTVVGPSSMLTYAQTPLFTNFGTRTLASTPLPQVDLPADASVTYIPWTQTLTTVPPPAVQCTPGPASFSAPQLVSLPIPLSFPEPDPTQQEPARPSAVSLPLEKLLEEDGDEDTFATGSSLFTQSSAHGPSLFTH